MKTIAIFPGNYLPHLGGLETHVDGFIQNTLKNYPKEYNIIVCTPQTEGSKAQEIYYDKVHIYRYPAFEGIKDYPIPKIWKKDFWKTLRKVNKHNPQIIMTRTMWFTNSTLGFLFSKLRLHQKKLLHVEHASNFTPLQNKFHSFLNKAYMYTWGNLTLLCADRVVYVSKGVRKFIKSTFYHSKKKSSVILRGHKFEEIYKVKPTHQFLKKYNQKTKLLYVGRLIDGKGVQDVIPILKEVPDVMFIIVGEGSFKPYLLSLIKKYGVEKQVVFLGRKKREEVFEMLKETDMFINPSYAEGQPTSVIEAIFAGANVIATDVGGTKEILEEHWKQTGKYILIPKENPQAILSAIRESKKVKTGFPEKIKKEMEKKFAWKYHVQHYHELMKQL